MNFLHYLIGKLWRDHTPGQEWVLNIVLAVFAALLVVGIVAWMVHQVVTLS